MCKWDWVNDDAADITKSKRNRMLKNHEILKNKTNLKAKSFQKDESVSSCISDCNKESVDSKVESDDGADVELYDSDDLDDEYEGLYRNIDHSGSPIFSFSFFDEFADKKEEETKQRRAWPRNRLSRLHVLRMLGAVDVSAVEVMTGGAVESDSGGSED